MEIRRGGVFTDFRKRTLNKYIVRLKCHNVTAQGNALIARGLVVTLTTSDFHQCHGRWCDGGDIMSEVMSLRKAVVYRWIRHVVTL